ncbi:hypothetical protein J7I44_04035 [Frateuria sp. MAH-13]|uniref:Uncharacterized protein n=1 Tax=Frateuria flava TaxID=2821489 RepID=A0ABS4DK71_9GAMM|nr:hypothetical protein [Frateuria flava]MBP1473454.1 hypothetical protein [Frateuria flava]
MRIQVIVLASLLAAAAAHAQSAPSATGASDRWTAPAPASTVSYRDANALPGTDAKASPFKFKERGNHDPRLPGNAAQTHSGKAGVGTMGNMDANGRPSVSCPQTPMDPACH